MEVGLSYLTAFRNIRPPGVMDDTPPRSRRACGGQSLSQGGLYAIFPNVLCCRGADLVRGSGHIALREFRRKALSDYLDLQPASAGHVRGIRQSTHCANSNLLPTNRRIDSTADRTGRLHAASFTATSGSTTRRTGYPPNDNGSVLCSVLGLG